MKITCPVCSTSYMVPDTAIGPSGRKVKCASCAHQWHQDPPAVISTVPIQDVSPAAVEKAAQPGVNVPAVWEYLPVSMGLKIITVLLIIAAYFSNHFFSYMNMLGIQDTDRVAFNDIEVKIERDENKLVANITGSVKNENTEGVKKIPPQVHVQLLSGQKRVMAETTYDLPKTELEAGESVPFTPKIGNISGNAKYMIIDLGNEQERFFRE